MSYDAMITRLPVCALFELRGRAADLTAWVPALPSLPIEPNTLMRTGEDTLCFIGPDRWLLRAPIARENALLEVLRPSNAPPDISIVRISDTQTFFRITGADAGDVMSIGCPLDLHRSVFGQHAVSYTEFFGLKALVMRCDEGFDCAVEQSFGDMIADFLARAMA